MKRVLIIAWYFPPAGGSAVQRILSMVRHLPSYGWEPVVVTPDPARASWPSTDPGLVDALPDGLEIHRVAGSDPYAAYSRWTGRRASVGFADSSDPGLRERLARWIRANLFLPDARIGWSRRARKAAETIALDGRIDAILTSGPPHSVHLAGLGASRRSGRPLVVDFRDLWPDPTYVHHLPATGPARRRDEAMRLEVLRHASDVVAVTGAMARELRPLTSARVHVIGNGYEEADFVDVDPVRHVGFELLHAGNLPAERNPTVLWEVLSALRERGRAGDVRVRLLGRVDSTVLESVDAYGLGDAVSVEGNRPHDEAIARMTGSDALLLSVNRVPGADGIATGKVYEYVASGRPVLGIGPQGGEADRVLTRSGAGRLFDYDDGTGVRDYLLTLYEAWKSGEPVDGATAESAGPFSRRARIHELATVLDRASSPAGSQ